MPRSEVTRRGFSLVEVVLALGIASFLLAALAGFFAVSSDSKLSASGDTLTASMINQVMSDLRSLPFDVLYEANPRGAAPGTVNTTAGVGAYLASLSPRLFPYTPPKGGLQPTDYYFSADGVLQPGQTTVSHAGALYHCQVTKILDEVSRGFDAGGKYNRMQLTLSFDWPVPPAGVAKGPNVKKSYASIARYF